MKLKDIMVIILVLVMSIFIVKLTESKEKYSIPSEAYRVYLDGEVIGLINSKDELLSYINKQQEKLKEKYNVDEVALPNEIDVVKDLTYKENIDSVEKIYNIISNKSPFTIKGYQIVIDRTNSTNYLSDAEEIIERDPIVKLYVLSKDIFNESVKNVMLSFISNDTYEQFLTGNVKELKQGEVGETVENVYIEDEITIQPVYIPVTEEIYVDTETLTKFLIFGGNDSTQTYIVKSGDNVSDVANRNKMSVNELVIANNAIKSENTLLYEGQVLSIGTLSPVITTVVERHVVEDETIKYKTTYQYDNKKQQGVTWTIQQGINGQSRVTKKIQEINGEITEAYIISTEVITPVVNAIQGRGGKQIKKGDGHWVWPTNIPYQISSTVKWRWGRWHKGIDICGTGKGSPIYAARDGVVTYVGYSASGYGHWVEIRHEIDGKIYYTRYGHMLNSSGGNGGGTGSYAKYGIKVGKKVKAGDVLGDMGSSGASTGTHLHFEIWDGVPDGDNFQNPLNYY